MECENCGSDTEVDEETSLCAECIEKFGSDENTEAGDEDEDLEEEDEEEEE